MTGGTYTVDVTYTDRTRAADGSYVTYRSVVTVEADDDTDATRTACQLVHCIRADLDPMVLGSSITDLVL